jgi:6-pyruvoyltetrahydropterin/6-carboxytetrahydropterin synthase
MKIRITKEFCFEASHALPNYDGLCRNIHGHSYKLFVCIKGSPNEDENSPKYGMIMDFSDLKKIVQKEIIDVFDHALILKKSSQFATLAAEMNTKLVLVDYQPTCENLIIEFVKKISENLPPQVALVELKLYETATSYAQWILEDNK